MLLLPVLHGQCFLCILCLLKQMMFLVFICIPACHFFLFSVLIIIDHYLAFSYFSDAWYPFAEVSMFIIVTHLQWNPSQTNTPPHCCFLQTHFFTDQCVWVCKGTLHPRQPIFNTFKTGPYCWLPTSNILKIFLSGFLFVFEWVL